MVRYVLTNGPCSVGATLWSQDFEALCEKAGCAHVWTNAQSLVKLNTLLHHCTHLSLLSPANPLSVKLKKNPKEKRESKRKKQE